MVRLKNFMTSTFVTLCSFASLLVALFCSDIYAFLGAADSAQSDILLSAAFVFFLLEFLGNALSDKTYLLSFFFFMDFLGTFSMIFDISYICGADVTAFDRLDLEENKGGNGVMIVRAARAARVGTRAGRLSRVAKIVRFLSGGEDISQNKVKMAKVISNKLSDVLSIRIAFVVILIAVVFPSFSILEYPAMEESMSAWTDFLADGVTSFRQGRTSQAELDDVVERMSAFYRSVSYGPFLACYSEHRTSATQELLNCGGVGSVKLEFQTEFSRPERGEFLLVTSAGKLEVFFDMSAPQRLESLMAISLIAFSIIAMLVFGTFLSENISTVAIAPMERMLDVVRHRCAQIFKYTAELQEGSESEVEESEHPDEHEESQSNEFELLEKAVSKLSAIASLSAADSPKETEPLNEDDLLVMNWTHGRGFITYEVDFGTQNVPTRMRSHQVSQKDVVGIESMYQQVPSEMLVLSRTEDFNPMEPTSSQKKALCVIHLLDSPGCKDFVRGSINPATLIHFVDAAESNYSPVPFHNFGHSLDVLC